MKCTTLQGTPNTLLIQVSIQPSDFTFLPKYLVMLVLALANRSGCEGLGDTALFQVVGHWKVGFEISKAHAFPVLVLTLSASYFVGKL